MKIPTITIKSIIIRAANIKTKESKYALIKSSPSHEYIGRGSYWGNPYSMYAEGTAMKRSAENSNMILKVINLQRKKSPRFTDS